MRIRLNSLFKKNAQSFRVRKILREYNKVHSSSFLGYLRHHVTNRSSAATIEQAPVSSCEDDLQLIDCICSLIPEEEKPGREDIWTSFIVPRRNAFLGSLQQGNTESRAILNKMFDTPFGEGIELAGASLNERLRKDNDYRESLKLFHMDALVSLAEYLGVIYIESREQNRCGVVIYSDPDELWDKIERSLGIPVKFPAFKGGLFSIRTQRGHFTNRDCIYLYIAIRLREMVTHADAPLCEIGAGAGYLAYYCNLIGLTNVTLVDIPSVRVGATYFLRRNMQDTQFFFGEEPDCWSDVPGVRLVLPEHLVSVPHQYFEVLVNCDSLPEMAAETAREYIQKIPLLWKRFLSIDQEAAGKMWHLDTPQNKVPELVKEASVFQRQSRNLFWIRKSFVEEVYQCDS